MISILVVLAVALLGYCVWMHIKCASLDDSVKTLSTGVERISARQTMIANTVEKQHGIKIGHPELHE